MKFLTHTTLIFSILLVSSFAHKGHSKKKLLKEIHSKVDELLNLWKKNDGCCCNGQETEKQGVFLAGGRTSSINDVEGFYNPITNTTCDLPAMINNRYGSTTIGFTVCGGAPINIGFYSTPSPSISIQTDNCETFDTNSGTWAVSYELESERIFSVGWESSQGIYLFGGSPEPLNAIGLDNGATFNLTHPSYYSCGIPDPKTDSIYIIGGYNYSNGVELDYVTRYGVDGYIESLPPLNIGRKYLGCTSYYDEEKNLVLLAVGGRSENGTTNTTEKFVVGVDSAWSIVDDSYGYEDNSCANPNGHPFCFQGLNSKIIVKYDFDTDKWEQVSAFDYSRAYYGNFASVVPLDSGVENWCLSETQKSLGKKNEFPIDPEDRRD